MEMKFKKGRKLFAECCFVAFLILLILGWSQTNVFMDSKEIGIEGHIYPAEKNITSSTDEVELVEKETVKKDIKYFPKKFPKTNQKQSNTLIIFGTIMIVGGLYFILVKNKLGEEE